MKKNESCSKVVPLSARSLRVFVALQDVCRDWDVSCSYKLRGSELVFSIDSNTLPCYACFSGSAAKAVFEVVPSWVSSAFVVENGKIILNVFLPII